MFKKKKFCNTLRPKKKKKKGNIIKMTIDDRNGILKSRVNCCV